jgi:threonine aldolase
VHVFARSGRFVVCEANAHIGHTEQASAAALSGVAFRRVPAARGLLSAARAG